MVNERRVVILILCVIAAGSQIGIALGALDSSDSHATVVEAGTVEGTEINNAGNLTFQSGPGQVLHGQTELAPGTELTIRIESTNPDQPFLRSSTAVVDSAGAFRAVFDFSDISAGTSISVAVHRSGTNLTATSAEIVPCTSACNRRQPAAPSAVVTVHGDRLSLNGEPGQSITGQTNLPPGTEIVVRTRSTGSGNPFIVQRQAIVDENGTFHTVFDFGDVVADVEVRVSVRYNSTVLTTESGIVNCVTNCEGTTTATDDDALVDAKVGVVQVDNGSSARIPVRVGTENTATLSIRSPATDYVLTATVTDGDGDGEVVVLFNTTMALRGDIPIHSGTQADGVQLDTHQGNFTATDYRLALHPPGNESQSAATGLLIVIQDEGIGTPLVSPARTGGAGVPWISAAQLGIGAVLAVLAIGFLVGQFDL